jgi:hypothetical protein
LHALPYGNISIYLSKPQNADYRLVIFQNSEHFEQIAKEGKTAGVSQNAAGWLVRMQGPNHQNSGQGGAPAICCQNEEISFCPILQGRLQSGQNAAPVPQPGGIILLNSARGGITSGSRIMFTSEESSEFQADCRGVQNAICILNSP